MKLVASYNLKKKAMLLLLGLIGLHCHSQSTDTTAFEYFVNSGAVVSEKRCSQIIKLATKKVNWTAKKIEKANLKYLRNFEEEEDRLLNQLCFLNEQSAENMMQDAGYSFNRYINRKERNEKSWNPSKISSFETLKSIAIAGKSSELDKSATISHLNQGRKQCACSGYGELTNALNRMDQAMREQDLIKGYLSERTAFLQQTLRNLPSSKSLLSSIQRNNAYLTNSTNDILAVGTDFSDRQLAVFSDLRTNLGCSINEGQSRPLDNTIKPALELADLGQGVGVSNYEKIRLIQENPELIKLLAFCTQNKLFDSQVLKTSLTSPDSLLTNLKKIVAFNGEVDSITKKVSIPNQYGGEADSLTRVLKKGADELKINPLKTKRFQDRLVKSFSIQPTKKNNFLPSSLFTQFSIAYQLRPKLLFGIGNDVSFRSRTNRIEQKESYFYLPIPTYSAYNCRFFLEFKINSMLSILGSIERQIYSKSIAEVQMEYGETNALIGLKVSAGARSSKQPTFEVLFNPLATNSQPSFVLRTGVQLFSKHSYR